VRAPTRPGRQQGRPIGHLHEARSDYQAAVALDIGTHFSHLTLRRLGELALS
jgi:hypothetical protein